MTPKTLYVNKATSVIASAAKQSFLHKTMFKQMHKAISIVILVAFIATSVKSPAYGQVVDPMPHMAAPGVMVHLSPEFTPAYLKGIVIHPQNALKFDFIIYKGDKELTDTQKREEYTKLTKYFLASLAIPDDDQWVNLSPYEKDRIIKDDFGKTEMGRDLLAQDYMLKQITASLIYPGDNLGKKFWDRVYSEAQQQFGTTNIPVNTFNKVWILPDDALIYEKGNVAYVLKNHLRVMLEEDYLSLQKHSGITSTVIPGASTVIPAKAGIHNKNDINALGSKIVRAIVLPELEREVNEGKNFAAVRQVYSGMLLAAWYKRALKESLLSKIYTDKAKVKGVDQDPKTNEQIYRQYLRAYKKGVFNFIKEDVDKYTNEVIPRKYFSGGGQGYNKQTREELGYDPIKITTDPAELAEALKGFRNNKYDLAVLTVEEKPVDAAMKAGTVILDRREFLRAAAGTAALAMFPEGALAQGNLEQRARDVRAQRIRLQDIINNDIKVHDGIKEVSIPRKNGKVDVSELNLLKPKTLNGKYEVFLGLIEGWINRNKNLDYYNNTLLPYFEVMNIALKEHHLWLEYDVTIHKGMPFRVYFILEEHGNHRWVVQIDNYNTIAGTVLPAPQRKIEGGITIDEVRLTPTVKTANRDKAQITDNLGGIDFNAANLNLQIKRDGRGVPLPINQQNLENIHIDGLIPVILDIRPAMASSLLSELQGSGVQEQSKV